MKHWIVLLAVVAMSLPLASCSKKSSGESGKYDPKVDAPPSLAKAPSDPGIAERQERYENGIQVAMPVMPTAPTTNPAANSSGLPAESNPATAPTTPASAEETAAIKAMLTQMGKDVSADLGNFPNYYCPKDAPAVKKFVADSKAVLTKGEATLTAAKAKGIELTDEVAGMAKMAEFSKHINDMGAKGQIHREGGSLVIVDSDGDKHLVIKTDSGYKLAMGEQESKEFSLVGELISSVGTFFDAVLSGINDGSITKDNIDQKTLELGAKYIGPARQKAMAARADEEFAQVKVMLAQMNKDVAADPINFANYWRDEDAPTIKKLMSDVKTLKEKTKAMSEAALAKGITLPVAVVSLMSDEKSPLNQLTRHIDPDQVKLLKRANGVLVIPHDGNPYFAVKAVSGYRFAMDERFQNNIPLAQEMMKGFGIYLDRLKAGIADGTVTDSNIEQKSSELGKEFVTPPLDKLNEALKKP